MIKVGIHHIVDFLVIVLSYNLQSDDSEEEYLSGAAREEKDRTKAINDAAKVIFVSYQGSK